MKEYLNQLNDEQLAPVTDTEGAILVLAGAGSGKTRVLVSRITYLLDELKVSPYHIVAITFTNKAAKEMKERVNSVCGSNGVWVSTFHSLCAMILRQDGDKLNFTKDFTIFTKGDTDRVFKRIFEKYAIADNKLKDKIAYCISDAKNLGLSPREYAYDNADLTDIDIIQKVYLDYNIELVRNNAMDFNDLISNAVKLLEEFADAREKWQNRCKYLHIDEFQDTNAMQMKLAKLLSGKYNNIFVVGDEDQSIYGWRGADISNILDFKKSFEGSKLYKLERNYRSSGNIIKAANTIIKNNVNRIGKNLWTDAGDGLKIELQATYNDRYEVDFVVDKIASLIRFDNAEYKDIAILVRNNALTRGFEEKLALYNMPYKVYGGFKFFERKEIKDILAYLRLAVNPMDESAIIRTINFPKRGIGETTIARLIDTARTHDVSLLDVILNPMRYGVTNAISNKLNGYRSIVLELIDLAKKLNPYEFANKMLALINITSEFDLTNPEDVTRKENIDAFVGGIAEFSNDNSDSTISEYLQSVSLIADADEIDDGNHITIATVHSVKGLEFDTVFIVGLEENIFPSAQSIKAMDIEEERRLMYVAITRAKRRLFLTCAGKRFRFGRVEDFVRSRFIDELAGKPKEAVSGMKAINRPKPESHSANVGGITRNAITNNITAAKRNTLSQSDIKAGDRVKHTKFGIGTIVAVQNNQATIAFEGLGVKKFSLEVAPLEKVE